MFHVSAARYFLYQQYIERKSVASSFKYLQLSDVSDIAFQTDPFSWLENQPAGLHIFQHVPSLVLGSDRETKRAVTFCFGTDDADLKGQTLISAGYILGTTASVVELVDVVLSQVQATSCQLKAADQGALNHIIQQGKARLRNSLFVHPQSEGILWNGAGTQADGIVLDGADCITQRDSKRFSVVH
eukprot:2921778-Amphidinium_carterae.1